jgi:hypothetical protein
LRLDVGCIEAVCRVCMEAVGRRTGWTTDTGASDSEIIVIMAPDTSRMTPHTHHPFDP